MYHLRLNPDDRSNGTNRISRILENVYSESNPDDLVNLGVAEDSLMVGSFSRLVGLRPNPHCQPGVLHCRPKNSSISIDRLLHGGFGNEI